MNRYWQVAFFLFALANALFAAHQTGQKTNRPAKPAIKAREVKALFKNHCAKCHGTDGHGHTAEGEIAGARDFADKDWQERVREERLITSITYGRGQMPPFEKKLSADQIKSLSDFVLSFKD